MSAEGSVVTAGRGEVFTCRAVLCDVESAGWVWLTRPAAPNIRAMRTARLQPRVWISLVANDQCALELPYVMYGTAAALLPPGDNLLSKQSWGCLKCHDVCCGAYVNHC
jgi:hypothetical protein